jgi:hypothetical protein
VVVIFILSTIQSVSGFCLALIYWYKQAVQTIKQVNSAPSIDHNRKATPSSLSSDASSVHLHSGSVSSSTFMSSPTSPQSTSVPSPLRADSHASSSFISHDSQYVQPAVKLLSIFFCLRTRFASAALLNTIEMLVAALASFLDRYLHLLSVLAMFSDCLCRQIAALRSL